MNIFISFYEHFNIKKVKNTSFTVFVSFYAVK